MIGKFAEQDQCAARGCVRGILRWLYLLKSGCEWRMLPKQYPKGRTVHSYFSIWREPREAGERLLARALKNQVSAAQLKQGRRASTSLLIVDAQRVKNTDTAKL